MGIIREERWEAQIANRDVSTRAPWNGAPRRHALRACGRPPSLDTHKNRAVKMLEWRFALLQRGSEYARMCADF